MILAWQALALLAGIAVGYEGMTGDLFLPSGIVLLGGLGACLVTGWLSRRVYVARAACLLGLAGFLHGASAVPALSAGDIAFYAGQTVMVTGTVAAEPDARDGATFVLLSASAVQPPDGAARSAHGVLQLRYGGRPAVEYGDVLRLRGRLQRLTSLDARGYRAYLRSQGVGALMAYPRLSRLAHSAGNPAWAAILRLREALQNAIMHMLPQPEANLLAALLLGGRGAALGGVSTAFVSAGMIHVVATSGLKVALVAGLAFQLAVAVWGIRWAYLPTLVVAGGYVALTGATPAGVRAGVMWALVLVAQRLGRRSHVMTSLILTAAGMAMLQPSLISDSGFQLSVVGTAGVATLTDPLQRRLHRLPALLREGLAVTLAAQLATVPIVAGGFGQLSVVGPVANALCLPLMALAMAVGGAGAVVTMLTPALAPIAGWAVYPLLWAMVGIVGLLASLPLAFFHVPGPSAITAFLYDALLAIAAWKLLPELPRPAFVQRFLPGTWASTGPSHRSGGISPRFAAGVGALALLVAAGWQIAPSRLYRVTFLNTGHGQAVVVQTPKHQVALIDGGDGPAGLRMALGALLPFWQRSLTVVLVSATDRTHTAGLLGLAPTYQVRHAADPGSYYPGADYAAWRATLRRDGVPYVRLHAGGRLVVDAQVTIDALFPSHPDPDFQGIPAAYRVWVGNISVLLLNRQALDLSPAVLRGDHSPSGAAVALHDTVIALPLIPQQHNASWRLLAQQHPALAVLPSLADGAALGAQTAPLALPAGVGQAWQADRGSSLDLWTDGRGYRIEVRP